MIGGQKRDNGLYLSKFETREEAVDYIEKLKRKYLYTPNKREMSLRRLTRFARNEGVVIYPAQLSKWFKEMGVEIRGDVRPRESKKKQITFTLDKEVCEYLDDYETKSHVVNLALKLIMRLPTENVVMFLPHENNEDPVNVIFWRVDENNIKAIATGKLNQRDKAMISGMLKKAENKGMHHIIEYAELFGYKYYGGNSEETNN